MSKEVELSAGERNDLFAGAVVFNVDLGLGKVLEVKEDACVVVFIGFWPIATVRKDHLRLVNLTDDVKTVLYEIGLKC